MSSIDGIFFAYQKDRYTWCEGDEKHILGFFVLNFVNWNLATSFQRTYHIWGKNDFLIGIFQIHKHITGYAVKLLVLKP